MSHWLRFRVWLWKLRFALRIWRRACTVEDGKLGWGFCLESAREGWENVYRDNTILSALDEDPEDAADEEMSYWTDDGEA